MPPTTPTVFMRPADAAGVLTGDGGGGGPEGGFGEVHAGEADGEGEDGGGTVRDGGSDEQQGTGEAVAGHDEIACTADATGASSEDVRQNAAERGGNDGGNPRQAGDEAAGGE